jgi:sugar phosphate isomerase/epimerase
MGSAYRITSGFAPFSPCADRFVPSGYREPMSLEQQMEAAAKIKGLTSVGLDYPYQFSDPATVKPLLKKHGFALSTVELGLYPDRKWKNGTFTSPDPAVRREAIAMCKRGLEVAAELEAGDVLLWPGQDGFDYPFQADYAESWKLLVEGIREVALHRPDVKIAIEYKRMEPRTNIFVRNAGVLLYLLGEIGLPNVGATIDLGHSLTAAENPAEAAVLIARAGKLFQVHVNDNYRDWDHDLVVGSACFWETLEFFYWIERSGYRGWYVLDIYPYREDGSAALQEGVDRVRWFIDRARALASSPLAMHLKNADAIGANKVVWRSVLAGY